MAMNASEGALTLNSLDFANTGLILKEFTCPEDENHGGKNKIPRLVWEGVPKNTKSFVLICDDPDAPKPHTPWVHWVVYNIPADKRSLDYIKDRTEKLNDGTMQGKNSWPRPGYDGPCPPPGKPHRYFFKLYALDTMLGLKPGATGSAVAAAMEGHVITQAEIVGLYGR